MPQPRILMCPPDFYGIEYEINPWMDRRIGTDPQKARLQWEALRDTLVDLGAAIELLQPVAGLPDLVFTANAGLVVNQTFISSRFRYRVRQEETPVFDAWFASQGFKVETLPPDLYFEGAGDALFSGEALFAGYRFRSDARGHLWIGDRLGIEVLPMELIDPRFYHLDTAIYYPGAFDDYGRAVLADRIGRLIPVSADESVSFSCNAVVVGRSVVLNDGAPKLI